MNEGYLSYILMLVTFILLASGWKNNIAKGLSHAELLTFLAFWSAGMFVVIPLDTGLRVQGIYMAILLLILRAFYRTKANSGVYLFVAGVLSGTVGYFVHMLYAADPILIVFGPALDIAILLAVLAWTVSRNPLQQAAVLSIALIACDVFRMRGGSLYPTDVHLGDLSFQDIWWLSLLCARGITLVIDLMMRAVQVTVKQFAFWMRGIRK